MKTVLVVGDWLVDEHWVVGRDQSETASRRGESHLHALHDPSSSVEALGGAGVVASLLSEASRGAKKLLTVHGIGAWHPADHDELGAMLAHQGLDEHNWYQITRPTRTSPAAIRLHSVCDRNQRAATTRAIRVYLEDQRNIRHLFRLDWAKPPTPDPKGHNAVWLATAADADAWWDRHTELHAIRPDVIVVKDLVKGVLSGALVRKLISMYGAAKPRWYLSSKEWHLQRESPAVNEWALRGRSWLKDLVLAKQDVRLFLVPPVAAAAAVAQRDLHSWRIQSGDPSWHAMMVMEALARALGTKTQEPEVVVLPDRSLFLRTSAKGEPGLVVLEEPKRPHAEFLPVASVFFAALVSLMESRQSPHTAGEALGHAADFTRDWIGVEAKRFTPPPWRPSAHPWIDVSTVTTGSLASDTRCAPRSWSAEVANWAAARKDLGIIPPTVSKPEATIELWRAMTDVDGYICLVPSKRDVVRALKRELFAFRRDPTRHISMLLLSEPGSGKTFLLDKLADEADMTLVRQNIARMTTMSDIVASFDDIVSKQASMPTTRPLLVFFDEINALIGNSHVYNMFLDPIDGGTYTREGRPFFIRPCAWIFAGTGIGDSAPETKGSDFRSRLTLQPLQFSADNTTAIGRLERVYVGASYLVRYFPHVTHASRRVLESFHLLPPKSSLRDQERFVRAFRDMQQERVYSSSIPLRLVEEAWITLRERAAAADGIEGARRRTSMQQFRRLFAKHRDRLRGWEESDGDDQDVRIVRSHASGVHGSA